jgi:hypothetical protein
MFKISNDTPYLNNLSWLKDNFCTEKKLKKWPDSMGAL